MLRITILAVGKLKENYLKEACAEYAKRLSAYCRLDIIEIEETRCAENPSAAQVESVKVSEGQKIIAKVPKSAYTFALSIEGRQKSSEAFAETLGKLAAGGKSHIAFLIGGSWGLSNEAKAASDEQISMSEMTFPHMLARVMLLEQLYRAGQINSGGSYHK